jgi:hypothetical protein
MKKLITILTLMAFTAFNGVASTVIITGFSSASVCVGRTVTVKYTTDYPAGTELNVFISDSAGNVSSLNTPGIRTIIIPTYPLVPTGGNSTTPRSLLITIPTTMKASNLYKVIVVAYTNGFYLYATTPNKILKIERYTYMVVSPLERCSGGQPITLSSVGTSSVNYYLDASNTSMSNYVTPYQMNIPSVGQHIVRMRADGNAVCPTKWDTAYIQIHPLPTPSITASASSVCQGDSITLTETGTTACTFLWSNANTTSSTKVGSTGTYTVTTTSNKGCTATATKSVTVNPVPPTPTITNNAGILTSSSPSDNQWYQTNTLLSGETNQTLTPTASGSYSVVVSNIFGCTSSSLPISYTLVSTGISSEQTSESVILFPNPATTLTTIAIESEQADFVEIRLISLDGKILSQEAVELSTGQNAVTLNLNNVSKGVYFVSVKSITQTKLLSKPIRLVVQ